VENVKAYLDELKRARAWGTVTIRIQAGEPVGEIDFTKKTRVSDLPNPPAK